MTVSFHCGQSRSERTYYPQSRFAVEKKQSAIEALAQQQTNWNQLKRKSTYTEMKETNPEHEQQELTMNFNPVSVELKTRKKKHRYFKKFSSVFLVAQE